jgi:sigma54-dependent transcription regulator
MPDPGSSDKDSFLHPRSRYRGEFTPENLVFNSNLQEFSQRVDYLCALETNGKITPDEAYQEIKRLYKQLKQSKRELGIGDEQPPSEE